MTNPDHAAIAAAIAVSAAATFALRALPFVLIKYARRFESLFAFLGHVMPPGMMMILSVYCLAGLRRGSWAEAGISLLACAVVMGVEHLRRQPVFSICLGLLMYVIGQSVLAAYVA